MKKFILITSLIIVIITVIAGLLYLNNVFLPQKVKQIAIEEAEKILHRKVSLGNIQFSLVHGLILQDLMIYEKDDPTAPFLQFKRASGTVLILPILKEKKIMIPSLTVESIKISVTRTGTTEFNFSDLFTPNPDDRPLAQPRKVPTVIISKFIVKDGHIDFFDPTTTPPLKQSLDDIQIKASLSLPQNIRFSLQTKLMLPENVTEINTSGTYTFSTKTLSADLAITDFPAVEFLSLYYQPPDMTLKSGVIESARASIHAIDETIKASGDIVLREFSATVQGDKELFGSPKVGFNVNYDPETTPRISYALDIEPNGFTIKGLPFISDLKDISGKINLEPDKVKFQSVSGHFLDTSAKIDGELANFEEPTLDISGETSFDLDLLNTFFPDLLQKYKVEAAGNVQAQFGFKGTVQKPLEADIRVIAQLKGVNIKAAALPSWIRNANGQINYRTDALSWTEMRMNLFDRDILTSGSLNNFSKPHLKANLSSIDIDLTAEAIASEKEYNILSCVGNLFKSSIDIQGKVALPTDDPISIDARGRVNVTLEDLPKIYPPLADKLKEFNASGTIIAQGALQGKINDWAGWIFDLKVNSPGFKFKDYSFHDVSLEFGKELVIKSLKGQFMNSDIDVKGTVSAPQTPPYIAELTAMMNVELSDLAHITPHLAEKLKDIHPSGKIQVGAALQGPLQDPLNLKLTAEAKSGIISLAGYKLTDVQVLYSQKDRRISQVDLKAGVYGGKLSAIGSGDLSEYFPFALTATLDRLNLEKLRDDVQSLKGQDISGYVTSSWDVDGQFNNPGSITGRGQLVINDGNLWQLDLLRGLGALLFIPEFSRIAFTGVEGDFVIANQRVATDNLTINSEEVGIVAKGWANFQGKLNFDLAAHFSDKAISESTSIKKGITSILSQANNYLNIKLTGTLKEPRYSVLPFPVTIIEETGNILKEGLKNIFQ